MSFLFRHRMRVGAIAWLGTAVLLATVAVGCVIRPVPRPAPVKLTAAEHLDRARYHRELAEDLRRRYVPTAREVFDPQVLRYEVGLASHTAIDPLPLEQRNPTEVFLLDAWRHEQRAMAHESAARVLSRR